MVRHGVGAATPHRSQRMRPLSACIVQAGHSSVPKSHSCHILRSRGATDDELVGVKAYLFLKPSLEVTPHPIDDASLSLSLSDTPKRLRTYAEIGKDPSLLKLCSC
jgi:hypothetical protein